MRDASPPMVGTIEDDYVEVRARYDEIVQVRKTANRVLRRTHLKTMGSTDPFTAATWRRLISPSRYRADYQQRIDAARDEIRSTGEPALQRVLPFLSLERRNWPIITGRLLLAFRSDLSFERLAEIHDIWARQQEFMFSPKVFWKVVFPLFALITGSQAHILGAINIPDSVLENGYFEFAVALVLGYSTLYFFLHVLIVALARREDEAMGLALAAAKVEQAVAKASCERA